MSSGILKKVLKYAESHESGHMRYDETVRTAVVILSLTAPVTHIAVEYLNFMRTPGKHAQPWKEKQLIDYYSEFSTVDRGLMLESYNVTWGKHLARAQAWLRDHELRNWVTKQNVSKGLAPSNKQVWKQKVAAQETDASGALRPHRCAAWKQRQRNQWIHRWAKRHKVIQGLFKDGERLPKKTLQAKVQGSRKWAPEKRPRAPKAVAKGGPENGHEKEASRGKAEAGVAVFRPPFRDHFWKPGGVHGA